ncbi:MAG: ParB N-terminal domain-containing protein [Phycisphaerales bacterium JB058]
MRIETVPITHINPAPNNPRLDLKPGDPEYEAIARSLDEHGLVEPLVWNRQTGHLVGGHQQFKILRARGAEYV